MPSGMTRGNRYKVKYSWNIKFCLSRRRYIFTVQVATGTGCTDKLGSFCPWTQPILSGRDPAQPSVTCPALSKGGTDLAPQAMAHFCHAVVQCPDRIRAFMNFRETSQSYFIFINKLKNKSIIKNYEKSFNMSTDSVFPDLAKSH